VLGRREASSITCRVTQSGGDYVQLGRYSWLRAPGTNFLTDSALAANTLHVLAHSLGFERSHIDEEDGPEDIFERKLDGESPELFGAV